MDIDFDNNEIRTAILPFCSKRPQYKNKDNYDALYDASKTALNYIQRLSRPFRMFKVSMATVVGKEKYSGKTIKTIYFGETEEVRSFQFGRIYSKSEARTKHSNYVDIMDSIYSDYEIIEQENNINAFNIIKRLKRNEKIVDLVITDIEPFFTMPIKSPPYLVIPIAVPQRLYLADTWETVIEKFSKNLRKEIKRVLNRGYQYVISHSETHFKQFYYEMYLPYTKTRFGKSASPNKSKTIQRGLSSDSEILFLMQNGQVLLGVLQKYNREQMVSTISATADNMTPDMIKGAFTAMDYFSIMTAFEKGCRAVDFLGSRPFLNNGPYRYKRKWGTSIGKFQFPVNDFYIKISNFNTGVRSYFANNPLITMNGERYVGKVLLTELATLTDVKRCLKNYTTDGLSNLVIYCTAGISKEALEYANYNKLKINIHDITSSPRPEYDFCITQMEN